MIYDSVKKADLNGFYGVSYEHSTELVLGQWASVEVSQSYSHPDYIFTVEINNEEVFSLQNERAQPFYGVTEFWSDPWVAAAQASIKNIIVQSSRGLTVHIIILSLFLPKHIIFLHS